LKTKQLFENMNYRSEDFGQFSGQNHTPNFPKDFERVSKLFSNEQVNFP